MRRTIAQHVCFKTLYISSQDSVKSPKFSWSENGNPGNKLSKIPFWTQHCLHTLCLSKGVAPFLTKKTNSDFVRRLLQRCRPDCLRSLLSTWSTWRQKCKLRCLSAKKSCGKNFFPCRSFVIYFKCFAIHSFCIAIAWFLFFLRLLVDFLSVDAVYAV